MRGKPAKQPTQPIVWAKDGIIRFKENPLVRTVLDAATDGRRMSMNDLALMEFSREDREQFAQLIGYSVSGFGELSYCRPRVVAEADAIADRMFKARQRKRARKP